MITSNRKKNEKKKNLLSNEDLEITSFEKQLYILKTLICNTKNVNECSSEYVQTHI